VLADLRHPAAPEVAAPCRQLGRRFVTDSSTDDKTDPYPLIGSGTTGVPAVQTSRRWIGYEPNHEYVELASERVEAE
jgi:DNA modification methylase